MFSNASGQLAKTGGDSIPAPKGKDKDGKCSQCRKYVGNQGKIKEKGKKYRKPRQHKGTGGAADEQLRQGLLFWVYGKDQQDT